MVWQIIALLLGCVLLATLWIARRKAKPLDQEMILAELDQALELYVSEITDSNRRVLAQLTHIRSQYEREQKQWQARLQSLEAQVSELERRLAQTAPAGSQHKDERREADLPRVYDRYRHLIELHRQGMSTEQIVKESGMNHGEVQLILQLASQEASQFKDE